jgi:hypothetical protein
MVAKCIGGDGFVDNSTDVIIGENEAFVAAG